MVGPGNVLTGAEIAGRGRPDPFVVVDDAAAFMRFAVSVRRPGGGRGSHGHAVRSRHPCGVGDRRLVAVALRPAIGMAQQTGTVPVMGVGCECRSRRRRSRSRVVTPPTVFHGAVTVARMQDRSGNPCGPDRGRHLNGVLGRTAGRRLHRSLVWSWNQVVASRTISVPMVAPGA